MNNENKGKDVLEEAKKAVACLPLAIPEELVCEDVQRIIRGLIQKVERITKERDNAIKKECYWRKCWRRGYNILIEQANHSKKVFDDQEKEIEELKNQLKENK